MSEQMWERNLVAIRGYVDTWEIFLREKRNSLQENILVEAEAAYSGEIIFKVTKEGRTLYLDGKYNPNQMVWNWIEREDCLNYQSVICILGLGSGVLLQELLDQKNKDFYVIVYEPCIDIFIKALEEVNLTDAFESKRVAFVIDGINGDELSKACNLLIKKENMLRVKIYVTGNYENLFYRKIKEAINVISDHIMLLRTDINTRVFFTDVSGINVIKNLKYLLECYSMNCLGGCIPKEVPCVVVAAGPSLNKNIEDLKLLKGHACIIACDTALKPLLNHGIRPDFFLVVDPRKPMKLFDHPEVKNIPILACLNIPNEILKNHDAEKIFYATEEKVMTETVLTGLAHRGLVEYKEGMSFLKTGGSVATSAFSFAVEMGAKNIILVGQDLAMTGNKTHADGTFQDKMEKVEIDASYIKVEGIDGKDVYTIANLELYLHWFEKEIRENPDIHVVDATEGGALIHGSEVLELKEVAKRYAKTEFDVRKVWKESKQLFDEEGKREIYKLFRGYENQIEVDMKNIWKARACYKRLKDLKKPESHLAEMKKQLDKIRKITQKLEDDAMAELAISCMEGIDSLFLTSMPDNPKGVTEEIQDLCKQGEFYLSSMETILEGIKPIIQEEIVNYAIKKEGSGGTEYVK